MHSTLFTLFGFAAAACSASIPRAATEVKPFEITEFNVTQVAENEPVAQVLFKVYEPNTNDTTYCSGDAVRPNEINFCNGLPQFVLSDDFATLSVSWSWIPNGLQGKYSIGSGIANVTLNCLDQLTEQGKQQCVSDKFLIQPTLLA
ncbi:hypothetical protein MPH_04229 [Macrophomina phaseolina MS6]|uniref:AA1-like domain-containing protein n=1 Tax=Macrophomina phaseolina (strain MS6) TaxID=1126212 RepID=K2S0D9_MACPH|nr:hypothetical protein MPH_04229 [Macrophomina phaseolina MS6]